jgi:ATP-dependent RNA helicase RhlE
VIRVLILTPTRELAAQVEESVRVYGKHLPLKSTVIFGGVNINPQFDALKRGVDIVVATPGRLLDHHGQRTIDLKQVETLVLDEADRMLDMGFIHDIKRILAILPKKRQNLLFSATFSDEIRNLATGLLHDPASVQVTPRNSTVDAVAQKVLPVDAKRKSELLAHLIKSNSWFQVLVFTRTKHGANRLAAQLEKNGISALPIHGNKSQNARTRALAAFKSGELQTLVATDIAARGLDIEQLPHVVNFDLPNVPEDYVHRIGRTGRAGATGEAISLVAPDEMPLLRDIERLIRRQLRREVVAGFESGTAPSPTFVDAQTPRDQRPAPRSQQRRGAPRQAAAPRRDSKPRQESPQKRDTPPQAVEGQRRGRGNATTGSAKPAQAPRPAAEARPRHQAEGPRSEAPRDTARTGRDSRPRRDEGGGNVRSNLPPGWK